mgnify:CR=1 FL=1
MCIVGDVAEVGLELPQVRVLFESGAGGDVPGAPVARFEASFDEWPPPDITPVTWYLGPDDSRGGIR